MELLEEQRFGFFLPAAHDYEKRTIRDNGPCIPCLAPIHKAGMVQAPGQLCHNGTLRCSFGGFTRKQCFRFLRKHFGGAHRRARDFLFHFSPGDVEKYYFPNEFTV